MTPPTLKTATDKLAKEVVEKVDEAPVLAPVVADEIRPLPYRGFRS